MLQTSLATWQSHNAWVIVSAPFKQIGQAEDSTIVFLNKLALVGKDSKQALQVKILDGLGMFYFHSCT